MCFGFNDLVQVTLFFVFQIVSFTKPHQYSDSGKAALGLRKPQLSCSISKKVFFFLYIKVLPFLATESFIHWEQGANWKSDLNLNSRYLSSLNLIDFSKFQILKKKASTCHCSSHVIMLKLEFASWCFLTSNNPQHNLKKLSSLEKLLNWQRVKSFHRWQHLVELLEKSISSV